jgi:hypothetical protein
MKDATLSILTGSLLLAGMAAGCDGAPGADDGTPDPGPDASLTTQIARQNKGVDEALGLVERLILDDGNQMVEFYQPTPGEVLVSAAGRPTRTPVLSAADLQNTTAAALYAKLAPGREIPARLVNVDPIANATPPVESQGAAFGSTERTSPAGTPLPPAANAVGVQREALTSGYCGTQWFKDWAGFGCSGGGGDYSWCLTDWYGGAHFTVTNGWASFYNLCPEIGDATLKVSGTYGVSSWWVPQNTYRWFSRTNGLHACGFLGLGWCHDRFNETGEVLNASTTTFNYMGFFLWSN